MEEEEKKRVKDLLLLQAYESDDGETLQVIWKVPSAEFLIAVQDYMATGAMDINEAKIEVLKKFYKDKKAVYIGVTDQDPELFAANLREEGVKARYVKSMNDVPEDYKKKDENTD
jgi:hypothetical protein